MVQVLLKEIEPGLSFSSRVSKDAIVARVAMLQQSVKAAREDAWEIEKLVRSIPPHGYELRGGPPNDRPLCDEGALSEMKKAVKRLDLSMSEFRASLAALAPTEVLGLIATTIAALVREVEGHVRKILQEISGRKTSKQCSLISFLFYPSFF